MRNSRKYINPSINGSRNIFTSIDNIPDTYISGNISGINTASVSFNIEGINTSVPIAFTTSNGTFSATHTLEFYRNGRLINTFTVSSRVSQNIILSEQFNNTDTITITAIDPISSVSYTLNIKSLRVPITNVLTDGTSVGINVAIT